MTERIAIVTLAVGAVLILLGAVEILESAPEAYYPRSGPSIPEPWLIPYHFDVTQLMTGIILALAGTAMVSTSLTYLFLNRKKERGLSPSFNPC